MGNLSEYIQEKYYGVAAGASLALSGVVALVATPLAGPGSLFIGLAAGAVGMAGATVFRPRSDDEIKRLTSGPNMDVIDSILQEADKASKVEIGSVRDGAKKRQDLAKVKEILNLANMRRGILQDALLMKVVEIGTDITKIVNNPDAMENDQVLRIRFDNLLHENFPQTLSIFYNTPNAASDAEIREEFAEQLETLHNGVIGIQQAIDTVAIKEFQTQGHYLDAKFGNIKAIESE